MQKRFFVLSLIVGLIWNGLLAEIEVVDPLTNHDHNFAIIVDQTTYAETGKAVANYRDAIEKDNLACYILIAKNSNPEEIKDQIIQIHNNGNVFEGVVFIGSIPVPMIRDAHHLSSAFKMNQERFALERSSIPSDRYYDDFDLKFDFIQQDTAKEELYYYSLSPQSPQVIEKDIYSSRIKAPVSGAEKYIVIKNYLNRIVEQKKKIHEINNMLTFTGHGYHSEALPAWEWELHSLREQFPQLFSSGNMIKNLNHVFSSHMKNIILTEMQDPELDIILFHAHGADDTQYLNGYPPAENITQNIKSIKLYLRNRLRRAKRWGHDPEEAKDYFIKKYDLPENWFQGAFVDSVMEADSAYSASLDIYASDMEGIKPQAKFIMFDECFNGQFTKTPYIAGEYVFGEGETIVSIANTVNVRQDIWADELLGMVNRGMRIGEWHKTRNYLESHLIGDPTFHFGEGIPGEMLKNLYSSNNWWGGQYWNNLLKNEKPALRSLAINKLFQQKKNRMIPELVNIYNNDNSFNVRLEALKCLATTRSQEFENILLKAAHDPAEMIRRITMIWMGKIGREDYLPALSERLFNDHSDRVSRHAKESLGFVNSKKAIEVCTQAINNMPDVADKETLEKNTIRSLERNKEWLYDELLPAIQSDTLELKDKIGSVRTFRNYTFHDGIDELIKVMEDNQTDSKLRIKIAEALGWFTFSFRRKEIIEACDKIIQKKGTPDELQQELIKTKNRLVDGPNNPITP